MRIFILITYILLTWSCSSDKFNCIDKTHVKVVYNHLQLMDEGFEYAENFMGTRLISNFFLQEISGIKSSAYFGDVVYYESEQDYKNDIKKWKQWFRENSCSIDSITVINIDKGLDEFRSLYKEDKFNK